MLKQHLYFSIILLLFHASILQFCENKFASLTPEKVVLQASLLHELIYKEQFIIFPAISQQPNKVGMRKPS